MSAFYIPPHVGGAVGGSSPVHSPSFVRNKQLRQQTGPSRPVAIQTQATHGGGNGRSDAAPAPPKLRQLSRSHFTPRNLEGYERHLRRVQCEGYLERKSRRPEGPWRKRWFRLRDGALTSYRHQAESEERKDEDYEAAAAAAAGAISISVAAQQQQQQQASSSRRLIPLHRVEAVRTEDEFGPLVFRVISSDRDDLLLRAPSKEEFQEWLFGFHCILGSIIARLLESGQTSSPGGVRDRFAGNSSFAGSGGGGSGGYEDAGTSGGGGSSATAGEYSYSSSGVSLPNNHGFRKVLGHGHGREKRRALQQHETVAGTPSGWRSAEPLRRKRLSAALPGLARNATTDLPAADVGFPLGLYPDAENEEENSDDAMFCRARAASDVAVRGSPARDYLVYADASTNVAAAAAGQQPPHGGGGGGCGGGGGSQGHLRAEGGDGGYRGNRRLQQLPPPLPPPLQVTPPPRSGCLSAPPLVVALASSSGSALAASLYGADDDYEELRPTLVVTAVEDLDFQDDEFEPEGDYEGAGGGYDDNEGGYGVGGGANHDGKEGLGLGRYGQQRAERGGSRDGGDEDGFEGEGEGDEGGSFGNDLGGYQSDSDSAEPRKAREQHHHHHQQRQRQQQQQQTKQKVLHLRRQQQQQQPSEDSESSDDEQSYSAAPPQAMALAMALAAGIDAEPHSLAAPRPARYVPPALRGNVSAAISAGCAAPSSASLSSSGEGQRGIEAHGLFVSALVAPENTPEATAATVVSGFASFNSSRGAGGSAGGAAAAAAAPAANTNAPSSSGRSSASTTPASNAFTTTTTKPPSAGRYVPPALRNRPPLPAPAAAAAAPFPARQVISPGPLLSAASPHHDSADEDMFNMSLDEFGADLTTAAQSAAAASASGARAIPVNRSSSGGSSGGGGSGSYVRAQAVNAVPFVVAAPTPRLPPRAAPSAGLGSALAAGQALPPRPPPPSSQQQLLFQQQQQQQKQQQQQQLAARRMPWAGTPEAATEAARRLYFGVNHPAQACRGDGSCNTGVGGDDERLGGLWWTCGVSSIMGRRENQEDRHAVLPRYTQQPKPETSSSSSREEEIKLLQPPRNKNNTDSHSESDGGGGGTATDASEGPAAAGESSSSVFSGRNDASATENAESGGGASGGGASSGGASSGGQFAAAEAAASSGFFGVYDGHCGPEAAQFISDRLHVLIEEHALFLDNPREAMHAALLSSDRDFLALCHEHDWYCGTTVLAALLRGRSLLVANLGDCEAVLCRSGRAEPMSLKHKPDREDEELRILSANGWVTREKELFLRQLRQMDLQDPSILATAKDHVKWTTITRLCGELSVSRAVGDRDFKGFTRRRLELGTRGVPPLEACLFNWPREHSGEFYDDLVLAEPDFCEAEITANDEFLLLACDGLWDVFTMEEAVKHASRLFDEGKCAQAVAQKMCELAYRMGTSDNVTTVVVRFHHSPRSWRMPGEAESPAEALARKEAPATRKHSGPSSDNNSSSSSSNSKSSGSSNSKNNSSSGGGNSSGSSAKGHERFGGSAESSRGFGALSAERRSGESSSGVESGGGGSASGCRSGPGAPD